MDEKAVITGDAGTSWGAASGPELKGLLRNELGEPDEATRVVERSTLSILGRCVDPAAQTAARNTGLVVGYVQSGKTLSFTAVAAAAHDNGHRIIVVIAGSTNILAEQSQDRLLRDLNVKAGPLRPWRHFHNPDGSNREAIRGLLEAWDSPTARHQVLLITLLKRYNRIRNLADLFADMPPELLGSAIVIDDEADQASLNSMVNKGRESTTYTQILALRDKLPRHTFLQYTATPQANLFIPLIDLLSPEFVEVLEPGAGYVGGREVFRDRRDDLVRLIPADELPDEAALDAPASLHQALRLFLVGVACGLIEAATTYVLSPQNRSMLVHPSRLVDDHSVYALWVRAALAGWLTLLEDAADPDRESLLNDFREAHEELADTVDDLPDFDQVAERLADAIRETNVEEVNRMSGVNRWDDQWKQHYAWVLVGGQKLDRGFTVEGLTVTYMPRGKGVGYSDTIQQRGRFFGYKRGYLGYCRIYLEQEVCDLFDVYVDSESSMREFLRANAAIGALKKVDLRRQFQMDRTLKPTRRSILLRVPQHKWIRRDGWFAESRPHLDRASADENRALVESFLTDHCQGMSIVSADAPWLGEAEKVLPTHVHSVADFVPLEVLYDELLSNVVITDPTDLESWQVALALVEAAISDEADRQGSLVLIRPDLTTERGTNDDMAIKQVFQGANPSKGSRQGAVYAGDKGVRRGDVTLQLHMLDVYEGNVAKNKTASWVNVPLLAMWIHEDLRFDLITQRP